jgi:hypothetical protein
MTDSWEVRCARGGWWEDALLQRQSFPVAPRNALSNLAYPLVGGLLYFSAPSWTSDIFALMLLVLGIGSGLYHWFKSAAANKLDHLGMYAVFLALVTYAVAGPSPATPWLMLGFSAVGAPLFTYRRKTANLNIPMGLTLGVCALISLVPGAPGHAGLALASVGVFGLAFLCWRLDRTRKFLFPLWGHAAWHGLTAAAIGLMYQAVG